MTLYYMHVRFRNGKQCIIENMEAEDLRDVSERMDRLISSDPGRVVVAGGVGINFREVLYLNICPYPPTETWLDVLRSVGLWWRKR